MGKTRAKQYSLLKTSPDDCKLGDKAMCVQIHGDASFAGQGVIMESLGLSQLPRIPTDDLRLIVMTRQLTPLYERGKHTFGRRVRLHSTQNCHNANRRMSGFYSNKYTFIS